MRELSLEVDIVVDADADAVYSALTNSEEIVKYYPVTRVESDWVVGGAVTYVGEVGGKPFMDHGVIEVLERPRCYRYSYWSDNHGTEHTSEDLVTVSYRIEETGAGTRVTVTQENLPSVALLDLMRDSVWPHLLDCLKRHVERTA